ncbi:hypothetical protein [Chamaesiphon sp. VAR_48_metabat_403]|nr:hypothetical protein [Chamaesiphon sp. VAR_48_metabat_403]
MYYNLDEISHQIEQLEQRIEELRFSPVINADGDIVSYDDLED